MKWLRSARQHVPGAVLGVLVGLAGAWALGAEGQRGEHLTYQGFVGLPIGASGGEVIGRIGYPVAIKPLGTTVLGPLGQHIEPWPEGYVWVYASPNRWFLNEGLVVNVLMRDERVVSLYAKYDDMPIFWRSEAEQSQSQEGLERLENELKN